MVKKSEMNRQEAEEFKASLYKEPVKVLSEKQLREEFRIFWAKVKKAYGKSKELEPILWLHLKSAKLTDPKDFQAGIENFGLKKIK